MGNDLQGLKNVTNKYSLSPAACNKVHGKAPFTPEFYFFKIPFGCMRHYTGNQLGAPSIYKGNYLQHCISINAVVIIINY